MQMLSRKHSQFTTPERRQRGISRTLARVASFSLLLYFFATSVSPLYAEHTRRWLQTTYEEFLKGTVVASLESQHESDIGIGKRGCHSTLDDVEVDVSAPGVGGDEFDRDTVAYRQAFCYPLDFAFHGRF